MNDICICEDDTIDFMTTEADLGVIGKLITYHWICEDTKELYSETIIKGKDNAEIFDKSEKISITHCPFCGRKL